MTENELRQKLVSTAKAYLGCKESDGSHRKIIDIYNSHKPLAVGYKVTYTDAWCSTFVSAMSILCGFTDILPTECGCGRHIDLFKKLGEWVESDAYVPHPGDVIFYNWNDSGYGECTTGASHVGIVTACDGKTITVIEGNTGHAVGYRYIPVNGRYIRGFGVPNYASKATEKDEQPVVPPENKKSVDEIAKEVILGKWGNGEDRKRRLTEAGYDYNAVQRRVNEMLSGKKSIDEIAKEVILGKWGNGSERKRRLIQAGYNYDAVQKRVNEMLR